MLIEIFQDTICPWCRIGKKNLTDALTKWNGESVEVRYRAFQLDPSTPLEGVPFRESLQKKMGADAAQFERMLQQVTDAGKASGLDFHFNKVHKSPNTLKSHQLIAITPDALKQQMVDAIYKAHFEDGQDIGDTNVLLDLAAELGLNQSQLTEQLQSGEGLEQVEEDLDFARQAGITGVPFFVINQQYALTGAQPVDTFVRALTQISEEAKK